MPIKLIILLSNKREKIYRNAKETVNDANDRAIRSSCLFFRKMLADVGRVVLITNDADNQVSHVGAVYFQREWNRARKEISLSSLWETPYLPRIRMHSGLFSLGE